MQQLRDIVASRELLWNLTLRELKQRYRGSFLGWTWSMLNPLSQMLIMTFVFGVAFGVTARVGDPSGIDIYGLYVLSGIIPWGFFTLICGLGLQSITSNAALVRKVFFPREGLVISQVLFSFVQFGIEMSLVCVALAIVGSPLLPYIPITVLLMVLLGVFATGIALMLAVGSVYFRDLGYLWTIISQVWFYSTPVIYDPERFDGRAPQAVLFLLHWNPPAVFLRALRHTTYDGRFPGLADVVFCLVVGFLTCLLGLRIFKRFSVRLAEEV
ncbi:MAG: ABC transporter permease [Ilumatobacteraceae bacterium]